MSSFLAPAARAAGVAFTLLVLGMALATTYRELGWAEMVESADQAFLGTVGSVTVEMRSGTPWTIVEFEVERALTGLPAGTNRVRLAFLGGETPTGGGLRVNLMPEFGVGERVLLFAYTEEYYSPIVGFDQALWRQVDGALRDSRGRILGLDGEGRVVLDGGDSDPQAVVDAVARALEARQ